MALGDPYATVEQLEARLGRADTDEYGENYQRLLDAASRAVEAFTRRQFNRAEEASPRRFRAVDRERLPVDDFWDVEDLEVEVRGVAWDTDTHIDPRPWGGVLNGQVDLWPYSDLFAVRRRWPWSRRALVTVTAKWGWASVPSAIVEATLDVAEAMSLTAAGQSATRSESIGGYSISYATPDRLSGSDVPPELAKAAPYRRKVFGVA